MTTAPDAPSRPIKLKAAAARRATASVTGMLIAVMLTLLLAVLFPLLAPRPEKGLMRPPVDMATIARQAQPIAGFAPLTPLPEAWSVNYARWQAGTSETVPAWEAGYTTDTGLFVALYQSAQANPNWVNERVHRASPAGIDTIGGRQWERRETHGMGSGLVADWSSGGSQPRTTVVIFAEGDSEEVRAAARTAAIAIGAPTEGATTGDSPTAFQR